MRIAQVSPLYESVPPKYYGGTERVVSYLVEELVKEGHDVTLFASGDSITRAHLVPLCERSLRLDESCKDKICYHVLMVQKVFEMSSYFDIIHFHIDYLHFPLVRTCNTPTVTTLHGRLDLKDYLLFYRNFEDIPVISISNNQRKPLPWLNWQGTVYHGLPEDLYSFHEKPGEYLAFLGRICPEKRVDRAIEIAERVGMKLKIAAKVDEADKEYFKDKIKPLLKSPYAEFMGEIGEKEKDEFLGNAYALIFPIDWPEPFGLVMIESLACGTPVIAWRCGSVPEVIEDGVTGFIVESIEDAVKAVEKTSSLNREDCRKAFEERFTASRMARNYLKIYRKMIITKPILKAG
ncbi:MAG: glycosyltransferase family 4 protein [Deltaproteobacteria bacterium]|nr:glycosyltransferase family 4 protein [Deltaproteobacteria bacterium]